MNNQRLYYTILLLYFVTLLAGQNGFEVSTSPIGLYYNESNDGPFRTGYNSIELKEFPIAINWSDGKTGDPESNLGTWRLNGDTITIIFYTYTHKCIWHRGYDKEPNFYSTLEVVNSGGMVYQRVSPDKLKTETFVKYFTVKGKAIKKKGIPMLAITLSDTINLYMDNLSSWKKEYLNKIIFVHGIIEEDVDKKMVMKKWTITNRE
ncbi:MAG: hypothetical protein JNJ40_19660 [Bacteroidia bacterium]|nr:hypothetical protein [Bacteroidia bacterium]